MFYERNAPLFSLIEGESQRCQSFPSRTGDHRDVRRGQASWYSHRDAQRTARALLTEVTSASLVLPNMAQSVNITELSLPQLEMLKNQLDQVGTGSRDTPFPPHIPPAHEYALSIPSFLPTLGGFPSPCETPTPSPAVPPFSLQPTH